MGEVDLSRYGGLRGTKLEPEDLEAEAAVVTVQEFGEQVNRGQGRKISPVLRYRELPDKLHYLNRDQMERLVTRLGKRTEDWIGKRVPIAVEDVEGPTQDGSGVTTYRKVYIMMPEDWDEAFKADAKSKGTGEKKKGGKR